MALANGFLGGEKRSCECANRVARPNASVCTDIPALTTNRKALFSLLSGRRSHGCGVSEAESVVLRKNATIVAGHSLKICLYSGKQRLRLVSL
jgi:hypothetical protein